MQGETYKRFDLSGRVAVVTGGGSGLGREFCDVLAEHGADIACPDYYLDRAKETCSIVEKYGHRTLSIAADVTKYEDVQKIFNATVETFGKVDILVNNAGISTISKLIGDVDLDDWHAVIDTNLHGTFYCLKECLPIMKQQNSGVVINITSVLGVHVTEPAMLSVSPYVASKYAIVGLTKEAASEYAQFGIRVNAIGPGFHHGTRIGERPGKPQQPPPEITHLNGELPLTIARTPLQRTAEPSELKSLLLYLAADSSSFMTGQILVHDGGLSIW